MKPVQVHTYRVVHAFLLARTLIYAQVSVTSQGEDLHSPLWCIYHLVFDPAFLLCVSTVKPGQLKWPGEASSEALR